MEPNRMYSFVWLISLSIIVCDSSVLLCGCIVRSFSLVSSIPLCGCTTVYPFTWNDIWLFQAFCDTIQCNSGTNHLELRQTPQVKGIVTNKIVFTSDAFTDQQALLSLGAQSFYWSFII